MWLLPHLVVLLVRSLAAAYTPNRTNQPTENHSCGGDSHLMLSKTSRRDLVQVLISKIRISIRGGDICKSLRILSGYVKSQGGVTGLP